MTKFPFTVETTEPPDVVIERLKKAMPDVAFEYVKTEHLPRIFEQPRDFGILHIYARMDATEAEIEERLRSGVEAGALNAEGENEYSAADR